MPSPSLPLPHLLTARPENRNKSHGRFHFQEPVSFYHVEKLFKRVEIQKGLAEEQKVVGDVTEWTLWSLGHEYPPDDDEGGGHHTAAPPQ